MVKISFIWSFIYEQTIHNPTVKENFDYEKYQKYIDDYLKKVKNIWKMKEKQVLNSCEEITGLKWKKEEIPVYAIKISSIMPISDPLTIPIQFESEDKKLSLTPERFVNMMVHEIIHNLFIQNEEEIGNYFEFILDKYKKEDFDTAIHLLLHSIHKKIFEKHFDKNRLDEEIKMSSFYPSYKKSWEIVNKIGEDSIIKEFKDYCFKLPKEKA
jgi:hypothetical protein